MKKAYFLLSILLMIITLSGCGTKETAEDLTTGSEGIQVQDTSNISITDEAQNEAQLNETESDQITLEPKVPQAISANSVNWECGVYYSDISYDNLQLFLQTLSEDGWKDMQGKDIPMNIAVGISEYTLTRKEDLLQLMIFMNDKEESINNSILVRNDVNLNIDEIKTRKNALTKGEATEKIQEYAEQAQSNEEFPYKSETLVGVLEIFIEDAYDKLELQAFAAITDSGYYGCFLIRRGVVSYVGGNLSNACIADIDSDGKYELIDLFTEWKSGIILYYLKAYEYINPIYFNSLTEILQVKYSNCFVLKGDYIELTLKKEDNTTVKLVGNSMEYGNIRVEGTSLLPDNLEEFPFELWSAYYDQDILKAIDKVIPAQPPEISITVDGTAIDYTVKETNWEGTGSEYSINDAYQDIIDKGGFIPTFKLSNMIEMDISKPVSIDFGNSIPDSIYIYDAMLNTDGSLRYGENLIQNQLFKIMDDSHIQFDLKQHMSYYLSSNIGDYERDWYRMFRMVCTWGDKEATYAFLINTGNTEKLYE